MARCEPERRRLRAGGVFVSASGALARNLPGFGVRSDQLRMARAVADAMHDRSTLSAFIRA